MSTPKTPMERAMLFAESKSTLHTTAGAFDGRIEGYLAGDKDREAIEVGKREAALYVPGVFRCAKCDLRLVSSFLNVHTGNTSANSNPQECSNGCGPMWRVTWEQEARDCYASVDSLANQMQAARADRAELIACVLEMAEKISKLADSKQPNGHFHFHYRERLFLDKHATLIKKLKAEKDTV